MMVAKKKAVSPRSQKQKKILLKRLNPLLTCRLCKGYLIDATTVTECLHTFCKSCIVKYLSDHNNCPTCKIVIHQSHPLNYISLDRTLQHIVYKVVPGLYSRQREAEDSYYRSRNMEPPVRTGENRFEYSDIENGSVSATQGTASASGCGNLSAPVPVGSSTVAGVPAPSTAAGAPVGAECNYHRDDEQVQVSLEAADNCELCDMERRYLRLSSQATVTHLKKYVALKVLKNIDKFSEIDIILGDQPLGKDHSLKFVFITRWRKVDAHMPLRYAPKMQRLQLL